VHELFHIKQWMTDKKCSPGAREVHGGLFAVLLQPIEVPAYKHAVREAERLGMTRAEIVEYLKMLPVTSKIWDGFIKEMRIKTRATTRTEVERRSERLPVKDKPRPEAHPPSFHRLLPRVRGGAAGERPLRRGAKEALNAVKVEFLESPFGSIFRARRTGTMVINRSFH